MNMLRCSAYIYIYICGDHIYIHTDSPKGSNFLVHKFIQTFCFHIFADIFGRQLMNPAWPSLVYAHRACTTPSVRKYLPSRCIKGDVSWSIFILNTSLFVYFDDKYFGMEGVDIFINRKERGVLGMLSLEHLRPGSQTLRVRAHIDSLVKERYR